MTDFCPNCFARGFAGRCGACGYLALASAENHMVLRPGLLLHGRYTLGRVLGAGGFGVTYLALDGHSGQKVAVKEYLPASLVVRGADGLSVSPSSRENHPSFEHGLAVFSREAQTLRQFAGNDTVVEVLDCFAANNTAYFVMEFLDGVNLAGLARNMGGRLPVPHAMEVLKATANTLSAVHAKGLLHRDVSPENVFVVRSGQVKLIDFGATRYYVGERSRSLSVVLKPGFAPPEQYSSKGNQGPWTDVYALCATFYAVVCGSRPPDAPDRLAGAGLENLTAYGVSPAVAGAVEHGMQPDYRRRPQSIAAFAEGLWSAQQQPAAPPAPPKAAPVHGTPFVQTLQNGQPGDRWILPKNMSITIGRQAEKCNVVLDDPNISRVHCEIRFDEKAGLFYLTDLSTNGTLVEAGRLAQGRPHALAPGERFYILSRGNTMEVGLC